MRCWGVGTYQMSAKVILLAEDSIDDEVFFLRTLKASGLRNPVMVVRDGSETIAYLRGDSHFGDRATHPLPNVLVLDLRMPKKDGFEVLEWLRSQPQFGDLFIITLTSSDRYQDMQRSYEAGAHTFLSKPCTVEHLNNLAATYPQYWMRE
jgi:CheY-like chemotaxis protein